MNRLDKLGEILASYEGRGPIVVKFIPNCPESECDYFIGASLEDILADIQIFKSTFSSYAVIPLKEAEKLGLGLYAEGYASIMRGNKSFRLAAPKKEQETK